jgi:hypothetical protein
MISFPKIKKPEPPREKQGLRNASLENEVAWVFLYFPGSSGPLEDETGACCGIA